MKKWTKQARAEASRKAKERWAQRRAALRVSPSRAEALTDKVGRDDASAAILSDRIKATQRLTDAVKLLRTSNIVSADDALALLYRVYGE